MSVTPSSFSPTPFVFKDLYVAVNYDGPDEKYVGFAVEVRKNLTNGELRELRAQLKVIDDEIDAIHTAGADTAKAIDEARKLLAPDDMIGRQANTQEVIEHLTNQTNQMIPIAERRKPLVAPYVRAWNLFDTTDESDPKPLPSPQQIGAEAFDFIDAALTAWLIQTVLSAYTGGRGFKSFLSKSASEPEPTPEPSSGGPKVIPSLPSRRSQKKSSSPSAATSKD